MNPYLKLECVRGRQNHRHKLQSLTYNIAVISAWIFMQQIRAEAL